MKIKNIAQEVNGDEELIVVTLDMQLYDMAMKLIVSHNPSCFGQVSCMLCFGH